MASRATVRFRHTTVPHAGVSRRTRGEGEELSAGSTTAKRRTGIPPEAFEVPWSRAPYQRRAEHTTRFAAPPQGGSGLEMRLFRPGPREGGLQRELGTSRRPRLSLRFSGLFALRIADRQFLASLFHEPPRFGQG